MIRRFSFRGALGVFQEKVLVVLYVRFSGTVMLVLASLLVPSLALVCVVVYFICEVVKICGWNYGGNGSATVLSS